MAGAGGSRFFSRLRPAVRQIRATLDMLISATIAIWRIVRRSRRSSITRSRMDVAIVGLK
jgi:hypothetical protein